MGTVVIGMCLHASRTPRSFSLAAAQKWGDCEDVSSLPKLRAAFARFSDALEHQRIVWLTGEHRPQDITLASETRGIELVR